MCWWHVRGGSRPVRFKVAAVWVDRSGHTIVALAALTAGLVVSVLLGFDDLDTPMDVIGLAIAVGWLATCWFATAERVHG
jgi:hypothetical protein